MPGMIKKISRSLLALFIVICGVALYFAAPYFADPVFIVKNVLSEHVQVTAYWKKQTMDLGTIEPSGIKKFKLNDEAAIIFTALYPDGKKVSSTEMYFTSGTVIHARITKSGIELRYE